MHPQRTESLIEMLLTYARAFALLAASIEFDRGSVNSLIQVGHNEAIDPSMPVGASVKSSLAQVRDLCGSIPSLNSVCFQVDRLDGKLDRGIHPLILCNELEHLNNRVMDELKNHYYYPVTTYFAGLYSDSAPFGVEFFDQFPSARTDSIEAGRCLALGQGTATVFHLMRVMEVALKVLGRELGITYAPSWEAYLTQINNKISAKHSTKSISWKKKESIYRDIMGDLIAVKMAWRNPTMHIVRQYDFNEANTVYLSVNAFMRRMANAKMREKGRPVAKAIALLSTGP
jgi:hypothetical protein